MSNRRSVFSFIKSNRRKVAGLLALALAFGAWTAIGGPFSKEASSDDIPLHDGDVLVDSLNVSEESDKAENKVDESSLVTSDDVSELENSDTYFQELRATLDMDRNKIISMLTDAENSASGSKEKEEATAQKMQLLEYMGQEKTIETLLRNKGLPESFVVITESGVNVTVNSEELDQSMVTKICDIVMRETGREASQIIVQDAS
ncbi:MAG: SpoIIIAH-like family protein [Anaerovoracaceae bacterium]|uniref:SpoIIIAH-like family protein n=1 Tax=Gallibacter sp. Marseille-QA0791 TaxID=3378781 RepID=UPI003A243973